jgi:hypothetical protein
MRSDELYEGDASSEIKRYNHPIIAARNLEAHSFSIQNLGFWERGLNLGRGRPTRCSR